VRDVPRLDPDLASTVGERTLEMFGETPRLNAWLVSRLAPHIRGDVLEIGSGIGSLSRLIVGLAETVVLSDLNPRYLATLANTFAGDPRVLVAPYDLDAAPSAEILNRRFDAIVAVNVIEHIGDDRALVGRLVPLLKPGGKLVVYVPACPFAFGALDRALGHQRRYTPATLTALLQGAGLVCERPAYMNFFGLLGWLASGRLLRRQSLPPSQVAAFERLTALFRLEDRVRLPIGLGIHVAAQKPGR
jgi:SAM-dependent methyltransferase